jgi:diguanylate cyclase (GGDEF)-like protein
MAEDDHDIPATAEAVEQLSERQISLDVVRWTAGEGGLSADQRTWLGELRRERGDGFYSDIMFALTCRRYSRRKAREIWDAILAHRDVMAGALGRNPGVVVAALDYLSNCRAGDRIEFNLIETGKLEKTLERAVVDGLTGLYDHETLCTLLDKEIERARRHDERVALLLLDLDNFKQINDRHGHQKGDEVLGKVADVVGDTIRAMDIAGRYGGEEFGIILPEADESAALQSAERLREEVEERFQAGPGLTVSIGVGCYPDNGDTMDALIRAADEALYAAKAAGKNRVVAGQ